jgi:hypothetical protein
MKKYIEFSFIRNSLYQEEYTDELRKYLNKACQSIPKKTNIDLFLLEIIDLAKQEIEKENYIIASYLFGLIHNFPKEGALFDEKQFYTYDFFSFYEHMLDNNRLDILKKVISRISDYLQR